MRLIVPILVIALSGCIQEDPLVAEEAPVITDPADLSYLADADSQVGHVHDYWGGETTLRLMEQEVRTGWILNGGDWASVLVRPEAGQVVPLGAQFLDISVKWEDEREVAGGASANTWGGKPQLWIKTAADDTASPFAELEQGTTQRFEVLDNAWNDIPHQRMSAWEFWFMVPYNEELDTGLSARGTYDVSVQMTVDMIRGLDIPPYPPHPDAWDGSNSLSVVAELESTGYRWTYLGESRNCGYCTNIHRVFSPDGEAIIPFDADHVRVQLDYQVDAGSPLSLIYHGADSRNWQNAPLLSDDGSTRVYHIPVGDVGDGPYALQSLWEFGFKIDSEGADPNPTSLGSYRLTAAAHRLPA